MNNRAVSFLNPYQYPFVQRKPGSQKPFYGDQTASSWLAVSFLTIQRYSAPWISNCRVNSLGCVEGIKQIRSSGCSKLWDFKIFMVSAWQTLVVLFAYYSWAIVIYIPCQKQAGPQEAQEIMLPTRHRASLEMDSKAGSERKQNLTCSCRWDGPILPYTISYYFF